MTSFVAPQVGDQVTVRNGMTDSVMGQFMVTRVSATGKRVEIAYPRYVSGTAVFYRRGERYVQSYGGVNIYNAFFVPTRKEKAHD